MSNIVSYLGTYVLIRMAYLQNRLGFGLNGSIYRSSIHCPCITNFSDLTTCQLETCETKSMKSFTFSNSIDIKMLLF